MKINLKKCFCLCTAIAAFVRMRPYFTWNARGILAILFNIGFSSIAVACGILLIGSRCRKSHFISAVGILVFTGIIICGANYNMSSLINVMMMYMLIVVLLLQDEEIKISAFALFYKIFALALLPGIIYFILQIIGVELPYKIIQSTNELKIEYGHYYRQYFGAVFYNTSLGSTFCGMMDEPGVVGTFCGLFVITRKLICLPTKWIERINFFDVLILIGGGLSKSKAFLLLLVVAIFYRLLMQKNLKGIVGVLFVLAVIFVLLNVETDYEPLKKIQELYELSVATQSLQMNRTSQSFDAAFSAFMNGNIFYILFGHGYMSSQQVPEFFGTAEIRMLVYDIGFIGVTFIVAWIIFTIRSQYGKKASILSWTGMFVFAFILSMTQRQYVTTLDYMVLLIGGCAYLQIENTDGEIKDERGIVEC